MLHRLAGDGAMGLERMDWDAAWALGRKALAWFALAGGMFLLCGIPGGRGPAPFAMAFMAAALRAGLGAGALLVGCAAAALGRLDALGQGSLVGAVNLPLLLGAALALGGSLAWDALREAPADGRLRRCLAGLRRPGPARQARSPNDLQTAGCAALAGFGVLIPGLLSLGDAVWPEALTVAAASVAAVAAAPFLQAALAARPWRRFLVPEERAGVFLLAGLLATGLALRCLPLAVCACGAAVQLLHPAGALAGVGAGAALLAAGGASSVGGDARLLALMALGGATARLCGGLSRPGRSAAVCLGMLAAGLLLNVPAPLLAGAGLSSLLVAPLPDAWALAIERLARSAPDPCDPQRLALRLQRDAARRLRALSAAFGELAEGYLAPATAPDEQQLMQRLRDKLCAGCAGYARCWSETGCGARLLCDLIGRAVALSGEAPLFDGEVPPDLARRCRRGRMIPGRVQQELEDFARARRSELKRGAENRLISAQFTQARQLLEGLAARQARPLKLRSRQALRAAAALERAGIPAASVMALGGRGVEIVAALEGGRWTPALARKASAALEKTFGRVYAAAGPLGREARFVRRPRLRARTGAVCASREAGCPSGDSHLICMLDDERLLALISDGMGSGDDAARESAVAARLLGRFLRAGASCPLAIETVNALMLNRGGEDMFATVDMLVVNLSTGEAELIKLAACPTLIVRDGVARWVEGGRLPLGILEKVRPGVTRTRLQPGDALLMASDGVLDAAGPEALEAALLAGGDAPLLARRALAAAGENRAAARPDDMTALCVRIEGRN